MNCCPLVLLFCVPLALAQEPRSRETPKPPAQLQTFDAAVTDAAGRPVPGLTASDFNLTQAGAPQKIDSLAWFDATRHTGAGKAPPSFDLEPSEIRRNFVLIVDDLGLTPERATSVQNLLREFVNEQLTTDDRAVILRISSGAGWQQQLGTDRRSLVEQIERVQPLGHGLSRNAIAGAVWQSVRGAADGLRSISGRKAVVLISQHLDAPLAPGSDPASTRNSVRTQAHAAAMVFYTVNPDGRAEPPRDSPLAWLIRETGGLAAPALADVLRDQESYYLLSFHPSAEAAGATPVVLTLRGKVLNLRWRAGFLTAIEAPYAPVPPTRSAAVNRALSGAMGGSEIETRITPLFAGYSRNGAAIEVLVHIGARGLSKLLDLKGMHQVTAEIQLAVYNDAGKVLAPPGIGYDMFLRDSQVAKLQEQGLLYTTRLTVPRAGAYQVRAAVVDGLSDRTGSAMQFIEVPAIETGQFAIGGLVLDPGASLKLDEGIHLAQNIAATRVFPPGSPIAFSYNVFNATLGPAKESRIQVKTTIYANGHQVYSGRPVDLNFPAAAGDVRTVNGKVQLDQRLSPGEYVIEVEATDLVSKEAAPRVAFQYITFDVR